MDEKIYNIIQEVYINKKFNLFIGRCKRKLNFIKDLIKEVEGVCNCLCIRYVDELDDPCVTIDFEFEKRQKNKTWLIFRTSIIISKVADVYYTLHEFEMNNPVLNSINPTLDGFGDEAYINNQYRLDKVIFDILYDKGYKEIPTGKDLDKVITYIEMPDNMLLGNQMTVYTLLFKDMWDLLD